MQPFCISVDWLQTFCHAKPLEEGSYSSNNFTFGIKQTARETQLFTKVFEAYLGTLKVATILQEPRNSVIHPDSTCIKLENRVLYTTKYIELLYALQDALHCVYKGITRLDLCYDCNNLYGGRSVERFLKQFVTATPLQKGHIVKVGTSKFALHGSRNNTSVCRFNSIRWGSPKSAIGAYCYNKTLELLEVKDKPWIREMWAQNGLISETFDINLKQKQREKVVENEGLNSYCKRSVWRFEISIKSEGRDILNMSSGELFKLSPRYMESQQNIEKLFYIYATKAFNFRINKGCTRIRDYSPMQLFEQKEDVTSKPLHLSKLNDSGRTEKICYNKLLQLSETYTDLSEQYRHGLQTAMDFLIKLSGKKQKAADAEKFCSYMNELRGHKFLQEEDIRYYAALHAAEDIHNSMRQFESEVIYDAIYLGKPISEKESFQLWQESLDTTPEEYIF